jgi:tetratricopeptide (TPR) repeat protein
MYPSSLLAIAATILLSGLTSIPVNARQKGISPRLRRADALIAARRLPAAEAELNLILQIAPANARALNLLGEVRCEQARFDEAEKYFKQSIAADPNLTAARINLARLYGASNRPEEAATEFAEALRLDPKLQAPIPEYIKLRRNLAVLALTENDVEKALSHLLAAKKYAPRDPEVLFEFAMVGLRLSLYDDAVAALLVAVKGRPDEPRYMYALARARMGKGEFQEAENLFRRYVALKPADASGHYGLGHVLALLKRSAEAAQEFRRSLELQPNQTESPYQLGLLAAAENDLEVAREWFDKVLARYADHAGARLGLGQVKFNQKDYAAAREYLLRAAELDPSLMKAHYYLGLTYARLGDKEAAKRELDLAAQLEREQKAQGKVILRLADGAASNESAVQKTKVDKAAP